MNREKSSPTVQQPAASEWVPLVEPNGTVIGRALRRQVHGNPELMHPVVHCLVCNAKGALLLQLRSARKDVQPGRWDTSVGGHVGLDEPIEAAVLREVEEEIGLSVRSADLRFLYRYVMRSAIETELVHTFALVHEGPFRAEPGEIDQLRFWTTREIEAALGSGQFTPNFEDEFARYQAQFELTRPPP
jgi:isopentenyldiphosphate isomerase